MNLAGPGTSVDRPTENEAYHGRRVRIGVFCGSRQALDPRYRAAAAELGETLADRGIELVYGGSGRGLMGDLADAALRRGGTVIGVMPRSLIERESAHPAVTDMRMVHSLGDRKSLMLELSDAFVALPGGFGTLDEVFEVLTGAQLGGHRKPCILANVGQFFHDLVLFLDRAAREGLIAAEHRALLIEAATVPAAVDAALVRVMSR